MAAAATGVWMSEAFRIAIVGSGPSGLSAAAHAAKLGLSHVLIEKTDHLSDTIFKYQKGKHVMATPSQLVLRSDQEFDAGKREDILGRWNKRTEELGVNVKYNAEVKSIKGTGPAIEGSVQKIVTRARDGSTTTTEVQRHAPPYAITLTSGEVVMAETVVLAIGTRMEQQLLYWKTTPGMKVKTQSDRAKTARRMILATSKTPQPSNESLCGSPLSA